MRTKPLILIVEDDDTLRRLLQYRLGKQYDVHVASNGRQALERVDEQRPDLIVSDIMMPEMDGLALQATLQRHEETRVVPFIFLTAKADAQSRSEGLRTGVDDYITKPFDIDQLLARVKLLLERSRQYTSKLDADIAKDFAERLFPRSLPEAEGYHVYLENHPREQGGGDLFDWTRWGDDVYLLTVGDVMGKGLQAKFYAFSFISYLRGTIHSMLEATDSPAGVLKRLNEALARDEVMEETFASLLLVRWDARHHTLTYANAGHPRPFIGRKGDSADLCAHSDLVLGLEPSATYTDAHAELHPGDALFAYTDGLNEQRHPDGHELGEEGVRSLVDYAVDAEQPAAALLQRALEETESEAFQDDILAVWLQREA